MSDSHEAKPIGITVGEATVSGYLNPSSIKVENVHGKLDQDVVQITVDRLSLILHRHADSVEKKNSWVPPFGILMTFLIAFISTEFKNNVFSADTWRALFIMASFISFLWLVREVIATIRSESIKDLVEKIKKQE